MTRSRINVVEGTFVDSDPDSHAGHTDVTVVIVTYNSASDIDRLLGDLRAEVGDRAVRVIVVDNESSDDTVEIARTHGDVRVIASGGNLGYAGGINCALPLVGSTDAVLILNPDLRVLPGAVGNMLAELDSDARIGAVVPRIIDESGATYPSLRFEPTVMGVLGDGLFGRALWTGRPSMLSEFDYRAEVYAVPGDVDWATGAALLLRGTMVRRLGAWDERFFLYSEEIEYCRRIRDAGYVVRYAPTAVVKHRLGGSGTSPALAALMAVNRVRYVEMHHGRSYSTVFRAAVALGETLRCYDGVHRRTLGILVNKHRWQELPTASRSALADAGRSPRPDRGTVIVPAYDEAMVIERTLEPLSPLAVDGIIELVVVCNGCTDDTADRARRIPGVRVLELGVGSKTLALNAGDDAATLWPRLYLDADIRITPSAVLAVLDALRDGDVLAARPEFRYGTDGASAVVHAYYRARARMSLNRDALWWAGVYGLSEEGHRRFGTFSDVINDDKFVDGQFARDEKSVIATEPSIWTTPTDTSGLLTVLTRHYRGNVQMALRDPINAPSTARATARAVLGTVRGPRSGVDAAVYLGVALAARWRARRQNAAWERDDTSRRKTV